MAWNIEMLFDIFINLFVVIKNSRDNEYFFLSSIGGKLIINTMNSLQIIIF